MKAIILALFLIFSFSVYSDAKYVKGYYRKNGTYVRGYHRSDKNKSYSYKSSKNYSYKNKSKKYK